MERGGIRELRYDGMVTYGCYGMDKQGQVLRGLVQNRKVSGRSIWLEKVVMLGQGDGVK